MPAKMSASAIFCPFIRGSNKAVNKVADDKQTRLKEKHPMKPYDTARYKVLEKLFFGIFKGSFLQFQEEKKRNRSDHHAVPN